MIPADRQGGNRARRGPRTDVIYGESETFWEAVPKVGKQQKLIAYTNWLAGEQEDQLPIVPEDIPDLRLEAVPGAFHKLFDRAVTIGAMRQRIWRYLKAFRFLG
jgi:hypothetical protein